VHVSADYTICSTDCFFDGKDLVMLMPQSIGSICIMLVLSALGNALLSYLLFCFWVWLKGRIELIDASKIEWKTFYQIIAFVAYVGSWFYAILSILAMFTASILTFVLIFRNW